MIGYGAQWGFCDADAIDECMTRTHDQLIAELGDRRRGGVTWQIWTPAEAIINMAIARAPIPEDIADLMAEHPNGRVVLALAKAVMP